MTFDKAAAKADRSLLNEVDQFCETGSWER
jgi:hypothetical protein